MTSRDEAGVLLEDPLYRLGVDVSERIEVAQRLDVDEVIEDEGDVAHGRSVVSHAQTVDRHQVLG